MIKIIVPVVLCLLAVKLFQIDSADRTHPFGTDTVKNDKYAKGLEGEDYGVGTFWGKPDKKDDISSRLNKIQWLTNSSSKDVFWRRSMCFAIISGIIILICLGQHIVMSPQSVFFVILLIFVMSYGALSYYQHHFLWRRGKFINEHVRKIKSELKLSLRNKIDENPLI